MLANSNIVPFSTHKAKDAKQLTSKNKHAIALCRDILTNSLPKCFLFLDNLDDTLFKLADQAKNNLEQSEYFAAMRIFRIQQTNLKNEFTRLVLNDFDHFFSDSFEQSTSTSSTKHDVELSILQNDDLEENIAITRIATKSNELFGHEFTQLTRRFAQLINAKTISSNPLAAESIATHLKDVISPITGNLAIKLQAYKQFEQYAINELKMLCLQLNEQLIKNQILPNLTKNKPSQSNSTSTPPESTAHKSHADKESAQSASTIFEKLRHFINRESTTSSRHSDNNQLNVADQQSILTALSALQHLPGGQSDVSEKDYYQLPELRQLLTRHLQADAKSVSHIDEDTIDVIDLLFDFILEDKVIPAPIRAMLARLQIPMLKVAISDKKFFSTKSHPARRLLNNLAQLSTRWNQQKSGQQQLIQNKIDNIVTSILTEFDTDIYLFDQLNTELQQFTEQLNQTITLAEQRIVKANEGQEKLLAAQQHVDAVINLKISTQSHLPKVVLSLIDNGLKPLLKLRLLQKGLDSEHWQETIKLLERLIESVSEKPNRNARKKLLATIPHLVSELKTSLSGASFNQSHMKALFKELQACHIQCINGETIPKTQLQTVDSVIDLSNTIDEQKLPKLAAEKKIISDEQALEKAIALKVGTWLEVTKESLPERMKFSWRSNLTGHCLFVSYHGLKVADLPLAELAGLFQNGQAKIIEPSEPLMDRALISMMAAINKQSSPTIK